MPPAKSSQGCSSREGRKWGAPFSGLYVENSSPGEHLVPSTAQAWRMVAQEPEFKYAVSFWNLCHFSECVFLLPCVSIVMTIKLLNHKRGHRMFSWINEERGRLGCTLPGLGVRIQRTREREVTNLRKNGKWAEFIDGDYSKKRKMAAWGAAPAWGSGSGLQQTHHQLPSLMIRDIGNVGVGKIAEFPESLAQL